LRYAELQRQFARLSAEAAFGEEADGAVQDLIAALARRQPASWLLGSLLLFLHAFFHGGVSVRRTRLRCLDFKRSMIFFPKAGLHLCDHPSA